MRGKHFERTGWWWRVEPWSCRLGYNVTISHRREPGDIAMQVGPNGGPYMVFGSRKRAIRKGERLVRRRERSEATRARLMRVKP